MKIRFPKRLCVYGIMSQHNVKNYDLKNTDKIMKKAYKKMEKDLWEQKHNH